MEDYNLNCTEELASYDPKKSDSGGSVGVGAVFLVGIFFSFLPQWINIIHRRSGRGISILFCVCAASFGTADFTSAAILQRSKFECCSEWGFRQCSEQLLPVYALMAQGICTSIVFALVAGFSWRDAVRARCPTCKDNELPEYSLGVLRLAIGLFVSFAVIQVCLPLILQRVNKHRDNSSTMTDLGKAMGSIATALTIVQYLPQLRTTYIHKGLGSFSAVTLIVQAAGGLGFGFYLAFAGEESPSTWLPPMVTGTFQVILLIMATYFKKMGYQYRGAVVTVNESDKEPLLSKSVNQE